ncbi:methyltransferase domain-containing protein [Leifsonia kafniensis]|uniref:Methyltransferase domain-containing protein n=1 Tax=Leifsonia kafniensis TaxID=475957 RepID=A0ABP7K268_9MICO
MYSPGDESALAHILDLDAEVLASQLAEVIDWVGQHAEGTPLTIADVGAGTGTGSFALARRFPTATIVALDISPAMLDHLQTAALRQGLTERMRTVQGDLDAAWPAVGPLDLAWASSSLHHFAEVDRVLRDIFAALTPGGLFVAVEMDSFPRVLPHDLGFGRPGLEDRIQDAIAHAGWNSSPNWSPHLSAAGFGLLEERSFAAELNPAPESTGRYAHAFLTRIRAGLTHQLAADDLAALDRLLLVDGPDSVLRRDDLSVRGSRTAWAARRP